MINRYRITPRHNTHYYEYEGLPATPNLAVTPSAMLDLANHGVPIASQQNPSNFDDGSLTPQPVLPENLRGVDAAQLWEMQESSRSKLHKSIQK